MDKNIYLQGMSVQDLLQEFNLLIEDEIRTILEEKLYTPKKTIYLKRSEVAELLHISLPTLHHWTKEGILTSYRIGTRVLYKEDEIEQTITQRKSRRYWN